jgi:hypothetical protein
MHATIAYCKAAVDWPEADDDNVVINSLAKREIVTLGENAVVLKFYNANLQRRHDELLEKHGLTTDYPEYQQHITLTYEPGDLDLSKVEVYKGSIVLGPEVFEELKDEVEHTEKVFDVRMQKADAKLGLAFGWAIICKINGEEYFDVQGDHIPEDAMLVAAADFMAKKRVMKLMHKGEKVGDVVFAWPLTSEISKAMGLKSDVTGLMIAVKPAGTKILAAIKSGKLTGFSIGGSRVKDEEVLEVA